MMNKYKELEDYIDVLKAMGYIDSDHSSSVIAEQVIAVK